MRLEKEEIKRTHELSESNEEGNLVKEKGVWAIAKNPATET
jgi:hypothetical protein